MDLKLFIKTALADITDAIAESQSELRNGALIAPSLPRVSSEVYDYNGKNVILERINFDIAVEVSSSTDKGGSAGIGISVLRAGIGKSSSDICKDCSRISFSVPLFYPVTDKGPDPASPIIA